MDDISWDLCCICQSDKNERLTPSREEKLRILGKDLNDFKEINDTPSGMTISFDQLNIGSGIAATFISQKAKYHKTVRATVVAHVLNGCARSNKQVYRVFQKSSSCKIEAVNSFGKREGCITF